MGTPSGRETDAVAFIASLAEAPYRYDFYQTLRRLECLYSEKPRWAEALRPIDEPVRLGQDPDLSFAPAPLASCQLAQEGRPPRLQVRLFGLLGPNGPLPIHITEYARERLHNASDPTLSRFLDVFHHRFLALFYRAWAQAQPHVHRDRPDADRFGAYIGGFFGLAPAAFRDRDTVPDVAKLFHVGALIRHVRNAGGPGGDAAALLPRAGADRGVRRPLAAARPARAHLCSARAGRDARRRRPSSAAASGTGSARSASASGPLTLAQYRSFLPAPPTRSGEGGPPRRDSVSSSSTGSALLLHGARLGRPPAARRRSEVPRLTLGTSGRLGWTTWLGHASFRTRDADDLLPARGAVRAAPAGGAA